MKLIVYELKHELSQELKSDSNKFVSVVRPYIYKAGNPTGFLFIEIRDVTNKRIATSELVDIESIPGPYFHGKIKFEIKAGLKEDTVYRFVLCSTDYEFNEVNHVGWCNSWEHFSYQAEYNNSNSLYAPLSLEVWALD